MCISRDIIFDFDIYVKKTIIVMYNGPYIMIYCMFQAWFQGNGIIFIKFIKREIFIHIEHDILFVYFIV